MRRLRLLGHRFRSLFRRRAVEDELERELSLHLEQLTREQMDSGLSAAEARRAARRAFGSPALAKEQCRDARRVGWLEDLAKDVGYASRLLARSPGFTLTAVVSLALGIGANTAIFSLVDTVLLRLLPVEHPRELVFLQAAPPYSCFERLRNETSSFAGMAAFAADEQKVEVDDNVEQVFGQVASGSYFDVLGLRPAVGRPMDENDEKLDQPVVVIGYGYWQRRFGGTPDVIGKTLSFNNRTFTIVGVTPAEFSGLDPGRRVDVTWPIRQGRMTADPEARWPPGRARWRPCGRRPVVSSDTSRSEQLPAQRRRAGGNRLLGRVAAGTASLLDRPCRGVAPRLTAVLKAALPVNAAYRGRGASADDSPRRELPAGVRG